MSSKLTSLITILEYVIKSLFMIYSDPFHVSLVSLVGRGRLLRVINLSLYFNFTLTYTNIFFKRNLQTTMIAPILFNLKERIHLILLVDYLSSLVCPKKCLVKSVKAYLYISFKIISLMTIAISYRNIAESVSCCLEINYHMIKRFLHSLYNS